MDSLGQFTETRPQWILLLVGEGITQIVILSA
jgi:hypothetical protein